MQWLNHVDIQLSGRLLANIKSFSLSEEDESSGFYITVTAVVHGGVAAANDLLVGDVLVEVDGKTMDYFDSYMDILEFLSSKRPLHMRFFRRMGQSTTLSRSELHLERHVRALMTKDVATIRNFAFNTGVMDELRPVFWRILLNYVSGNSEEWGVALGERRALYRAYVKEFGNAGKSNKDSSSSRPGRLHGQGWWETELNTDKPDSHVRSEEEAGMNGLNVDMNIDRQQIKEEAEDIHDSNIDNTIGLFMRDPLSESLVTKNDIQEGSDQEIRETLGEKEDIQEESDQELRETIWKDVQRTHPGFHFFADSRCEVMERILFTYAKLNPGIKYVQGMNEILAPILFVFGASEKTAIGQRLSFSRFEFEANYEADSFFCFCNLMAELRDLYTMDLDGDHEGITGKGEALMKLLEIHDRQVFDHLNDLEIHPQFFSMRWITTLLSRELELPDTVRMWDALLSDNQRGELTFLLQACCAMIIMQRKAILESDFANCIQILQKYPMTDVHDILEVAMEIRTLKEISFISKKTTTQMMMGTLEKAEFLGQSLMAKLAFK